MRVAVDCRMEHPVVIGRNRDDAFEPHRILDGDGARRRHLQVTHHVLDARDQHRHVLGVDRTGSPGLGGERRLTARGRGVLQVTRLARILRTIGGDDDVIQAEGEHHAARKVVLLLTAGHRPVAVRPQVFIEVAAVQVDQVIAFLYNLFRDHVRRALGLRPAHGARIEPIHALVVDGIDMRHEALERRDVDERHEDQRAGELRGIDRVDQLPDRDDRGVFGTMRA